MLGRLFVTVDKVTDNLTAIFSMEENIVNWATETKPFSSFAIIAIGTIPCFFYNIAQMC